MDHSKDFSTASKLIQELSDVVGTWQSRNMCFFDGTTHMALNDVRGKLSEISCTLHSLSLYWKYRKD